MLKFILIIIFSYGLSLYSNGKNFPFGMNNTVYSEFDEQKYRNNVKIYKQTIDSTASLGIKWWRALNKFTWISVEPDSGIYDWSNEDSLVKWTGKKGIYIIPVIGYKYPTWAHHDEIPEDYWEEYPFNTDHWKQYTNFIKTMAERYDGDGEGDMDGLILPIKYWECMNEPYDKKNFLGNLSQYAEIFDSTRAALKRADPEAKLGGPCLNSKDTNLTWYYYDTNANKLKDTTYAYIDMLNDILNNIDTIDFITHHIYHYTLDGPKLTMNDIKNIRDKISESKIKDSIPLWITECGYQWYRYYHKYYPGVFDNRYTFYNTYYNPKDTSRDTVWIADTAYIYWVDTTRKWKPTTQALKYSELLNSISTLLNEESNYKFFFYSINVLTQGRLREYDTILETIFCNSDICTLKVRTLKVQDPLWDTPWNNYDSISRQLSILKRNFKPLPAYDTIKKHIKNNFHEPQLSNKYLYPASGNRNMRFSYIVHYSDKDGDIPTHKNIFIDGNPYSMSLYTGTQANGYYAFDTILPIGTHKYYFYFEDKFGGYCRFPKIGAFTGPRVK